MCPGLQLCAFRPHHRTSTGLQCRPYQWQHTASHVAESAPSAPKGLSLDLRYLPEATAEGVGRPEVKLQLLDLRDKGHLGPGVSCDLMLEEGQAVWYEVSGRVE
jgi:hypothetical protein